MHGKPYHPRAPSKMLPNMVAWHSWLGGMLPSAYAGPAHGAQALDQAPTHSPLGGSETPRASAGSIHMGRAAESMGEGQHFSVMVSPTNCHCQGPLQGTVNRCGSVSIGGRCCRKAGMLRFLGVRWGCPACLSSFPWPPAPPTPTPSLESLPLPFLTNLVCSRALSTAPGPLASFLPLSPPPLSPAAVGIHYLNNPCL